ncbi:sensor histidine kinase [Flavobacterium sp. KACC 22763]|uniref:sensor histidine kinase n=1 Tax=Flavobacterium sp. KACC 22763 TaxID=3025668 RepID=UPI0023663FC9|nr:ATP-binding protein [Flavobacterium sp. KACC 22763]WDF65982.1 ATP-binding protein [Flavobacterium sp. KACC 22763]
MNQIVLGIIIAFIFIGLILFFCVILIRLYFNKIRKYTELLHEKDLNFQKAITQTVIETQEQVLNNISEDLHDDAGQQLTYINFQIENMKLDSPELEKILEPVSQSLGNLSKSIRSISHALNSQMLLQQDVIKAIIIEIERLQKNNKIQIIYSFEEIVVKKFSDNEKIIIYRIFQECISNILKHAKASKMNVSITTKPHFKMTITDNGKGFNSADKKDQLSLGLTNMANRANSIAYHLTVESEVGSGTKITLSENKKI